jgi:hypothetical protein
MMADVVSMMLGGSVVGCGDDGFCTEATCKPVVVWVFSGNLREPNTCGRDATAQQ